MDGRAARYSRSAQPMINNFEECLEENEWVTKTLPAPFLA